MNNKLYQQLQTSSEVNPYKHDGCYELIQRVVSAYKEEVLEAMDYRDLNAIYFMVIGTWKSSFEHKKKVLLESRLSPENKDSLCLLVDDLKIKTENNEFSNGQTLGMFGSGFMSFKNSVNELDSQKFINLCLNIIDTEEDEELFQLIDDAFTEPMKGIRTATASIILHCLKPYSFPIINGKEGKGTEVYVALDIPIDKQNDLSSYIKNTRAIKTFRDKHFSFKNYRVFDLVRIEDVSLGWFVGANYNGIDQTQRFIDNGIWENGYDDKFIELVNEIQVGDRIAIKAAFTQKKDLPFNANGNSTSVMSIKAIGTVTQNHHDGKNLDVDWIPFIEIKKWYFFTFRQTIWKVATNPDDWMYQALLDFTFNDVPQDIDRFMAHPFWADRYSSYEEEIDEGNDMDRSKPLPYSTEDFLKDVFISAESYHKLRTLLLRKKNIILLGAPGVGKTYAAKRLAYALMGEKDDARVNSVQFHQSYTYEDFIMGYRPDENSFSLKYGVFYKFCKLAEEHPDQPYFFIIDEINRGNLSKIFGELLMLIECDKRGQSLILTYSDKEFSVPENLYIIGMMNTADRSLAIIDYALRRRFSFFELEPAFGTTVFRDHLMKNDVDELLADKIVNRLNYINNEIEQDDNLGKGFRIGHSYFCDCTNGDDAWYESIIEYEIVPLLSEYWFDDQQKSRDYAEELLK